MIGAPPHGSDRASSSRAESSAPGISRIDGKVEGSIEVGDHVLMVGARASVKANLVAKSILISGTVIGNVTATERLDLQATGSVEGDISSPRLVMVDGAVVRGKVDAIGNRAKKT